jgi:hypothetical protein
MRTRKLNLSSDIGMAGGAARSIMDEHMLKNHLEGQRHKDQKCLVNGKCRYNKRIERLQKKAGAAAPVQGQKP